MSDLDEEKQDLIELITWYKNKYHKSDWVHSELIDRANKATTMNELISVWDVVDSWLDFSDR